MRAYLYAGLHAATGGSRRQFTFAVRIWAHRSLNTRVIRVSVTPVFGVWLSLDAVGAESGFEAD